MFMLPTATQEQDGLLAAPSDGLEDACAANDMGQRTVAGQKWASSEARSSVE
jgi:hypothetical protein